LKFPQPRHKSIAAKDRFFDRGRALQVSGAQIEVAWAPSRSSHLLEGKEEDMARRLGLGGDISYDVREGWDPNDLLHPAQAFEHPSHVVNDPDLTLNEKRAVLASWASEACALEAAPHLRSAPGGKQPVLFDDVMEALRTLDKQANEKDSALLANIATRRLEQRPRPPSLERRSIN